MKKNQFRWLGFLAFWTSSVFAAHPLPYGMAGCGLGTLAFEGQNGKEQVVASTLNATGMQTIALTVGTSNCKEDAVSASTNYISINQVALKKDAARGEGESIEGLGTILNCSNNKLLASTLQSNYNEIFSTEKFDSIKVSEKIVNKIKTTPELNSQCLAGK